MIPNVDDLIDDFEIEEQPSKTYKLNLEKFYVAGTVDGLSAIEQTIFKILNTERYESIIYSWDYGIELNDLFGEPIEYVYPELKRRITEALMQDERITGVDEFSFTKIKNQVAVKFIVHATEGDIEAQKAVNI
jgi:phage baseplate assembly protein W